MMITLKNKSKLIEELIVIIILMVCINVPESIFTFRYYEWIPLSMDAIIIFVYLLVHRGKIRFLSIYKELIRQFVIPTIVPSIIATITAIYIYHNTRYIMSSFKYVLWVYGAYLFAYFLYQRYKFTLFYLLLIAGSISYFTTVCKALIQNNMGYLEVHELTYIYGIFLLFFSLCSNISVKIKARACILCIIGIILGDKRALWLALAISYCLYFVFYKILKNRLRGLRVVAFLAIFVGLFWIWFIHSGLFELACIRFGINDMSRIKMWNYFAKDYSLSPMYWGRGLTYTLVIMGEIHSTLYISTAIPIHNWVLSTYIGWGCIPLLYYLYYFLYKRIAVMINAGYRNTPWVFAAITMMFYIINFFGDTMFNIGISIVYMGIWLFLQEKDTMIRK